MPLNKVQKNIFHNSQKGLTLLELVICTMVIAILVVSLYSMLKNITLRSRDAVRLADMSNLFQAIQSKIQADETSEKLYYTLCSQVKTPCEGSSFPVNNDTQKTDGSGWLKIIFSRKELIKYAILPLDPLNNIHFNYRYFSDGKMWKLETKLESDRYKSKMENDGGSDPNKYELTQILK